MLGGDADGENSISETRWEGGAWAGGVPGHPATVKTPPYQCCIPECLSQNRHRAWLIPADCGRTSIAAGLWRGLWWLLLGHCSLPGPPVLFGCTQSALEKQEGMGMGRLLLQPSAAVPYV